MWVFNFISKWLEKKLAFSFENFLKNIFLNYNIKYIRKRIIYKMENKNQPKFKHSQVSAINILVFQTCFYKYINIAEWLCSFEIIVLQTTYYLTLY